MPLTKITSSGITDSAVTTEKILDGTVLDADIASAAGISPSKFGYNVTQPAVTSFTPEILDNSEGGTITITGTGFVSVPNVEFQNQSTGAITLASTVSFTSSTSITCTIGAFTAGTYKIRVENPGGLAAVGSTILTGSGEPTWQTSAGSLGSFAKSASDLSYSAYATAPDSGAITYAQVSGTLPPGLTLSTSNDRAYITGTHTGSETEATTYTFSLEATDPESQKTTRSFSLSVTVSMSNGGGFC